MDSRSCITRAASSAVHAPEKYAAASSQIMPRAVSSQSVELSTEARKSSKRAVSSGVMRPSASASDSSCSRYGRYMGSEALFSAP